jgi:Carboxypeptidase regulatory-like domain/PDZ domain
MKRRAVVARIGLGVAVLAALAMWLLRCRDATPGATAPADLAARGAAITANRAGAVDPRGLPRGSISGAIRDPAGAPVPGARVCAAPMSPGLPDEVSEPVCVASDARGGYRIAALVAAEYTVHASARSFYPAVFAEAGPHARRRQFPLAAGEARTGVDLVLHRGGTEVTGVVLDLTGGPIARARVRALTEAGWGVPVETDEQGRFTLWLGRGYATLHAHADGYAHATVRGQPSHRFEIRLTPASSLAGRVIDAATRVPVAGAKVTLEASASSEADPESEVTDAQGAFRFTRLTPGRYRATAVTEHGYGRSAGSTLVGLAQHVDGMEIELFPARRVAGRIVTATGEPCPHGRVTLRDRAHDRTVVARGGPDGQLVLDGVRPGSYDVAVDCDGHRARERYDAIAVGDADVTGRVWEVDAGARIRGKVTLRSGAPVDAVELFAQHIDAAPRDGAAWAGAHSGPDGSYELSGLAAGTHRITLTTERGVAPPDGYLVAVAAAATVERDLVLDDGGTLVGSVVDATGAPVANVRISIEAAGRIAILPDVWSDTGGRFTIEALAPGDYRIGALSARGELLQAPGTASAGGGGGDDDDRDDSSGGEDSDDGDSDDSDARVGLTVTVRAGQTTTARLVVEAARGAIRGRVLDATGAPVADAYVAHALEYEGGGTLHAQVARTRGDWWGDDRTVLTSTDGRFTIDALQAGSYTLRAYRRGGGEAIAEHVAVGATVTLQIRPTASIEGIARAAAGPPPEELTVALRDRAIGFERTETFFRTGGRFEVRDLPAGRFTLTVDGDDGRGTLALALAEGEAKTGVAVMLERLVTVTGRLVAHPGRRPLPRQYVLVSREGELDPSLFSQLEVSGQNVSDGEGRFALHRVPVGRIMLTVFRKEMENEDPGLFRAVRTVAGTGTVDIGDIVVVRSRLSPGQDSGDLGLRIAEPPAVVPPEQHELRIAAIAPTGPAARTGLQVGDVITSCDGIDVTGANAEYWPMLSEAPPGTRLVLGTKRGTTATIVLAPPAP